MSYLTAATTSIGADFLRRFRPCAANYIVQFRRGVTSGAYFITPHPGYSVLRSAAPPTSTSPPYGIAPEEAVLPDVPQYGIWYIGTETECEQKLDRDLALLVCSGFNAVRIVGIGPVMNSNGLTYPIVPQSDASLSEYLGLLTKLLSKVAAHGLKAILLLGANGPNAAQWSQPDLYRQFLIDVCTQIGDHPGLLAYDLYNEPAWGYPWSATTNKLLSSHWIADSYWTIKSVSPRQMVTIGLTHPDTIGSWDPGLIPVDFVSYHFYSTKPLYGEPPLTHAIDQLTSMFHWAMQTSRRPWIIGETALAGSDDPQAAGPIGTEADQKTFAEETLQASLDTGCVGYSWWQYHEVRWGDGSDYMGLITRRDPANASSSEQKKAAFSTFASYAGLSPQPQNAVKPSIYPNLENHPALMLQGHIFDEDSQPLGDVSVVGKDQSWASYSTISAADGSFILKAPSGTVIATAEATKPGYSVVDPRITPNNVVLEAWRDDTWSRRWVASTPGKLNFSAASSPLDWVIDPTDRFYVGDFDGDGADELLCVQNLGSSTGDAMRLLRFDGNWTEEWTNGNDPATGNGIYPYRGQLIVGDFDGDGADELLGAGAPGDWITLFKYQNGDWQWVSSTAGNQQHALRPYAHNLHVGNFNGSGGEQLLGVDAWTTLFKFNPGINDWEWVDSDYQKTNDSAHPLSAIRPYAAGLMIGDFDGDGRDELLGIPGGGAGSWVTLFGVRGTGSFEWLISNYGSEATVLSGILPYRGRAIVGRFDGLGRERILGLADHAAMFGLDGEDFRQMWGSFRTRFAGLEVTPADKVLAFRPLRLMPDYLLVIPSAGKKASLIAFDPVLKA